MKLDKSFKHFEGTIGIIQQIFSAKNNRKRRKFNFADIASSSIADFKMHKDDGQTAVLMTYRVPNFFTLYI